MDNVDRALDFCASQEGQSLMKKNKKYTFKKKAKAFLFRVLENALIPAIISFIVSLITTLIFGGCK